MPAKDNEWGGPQQELGIRMGAGGVALMCNRLPSDLIVRHFKAINLHSYPSLVSMD